MPDIAWEIRSGYGWPMRRILNFLDAFTFRGILYLTSMESNEFSALERLVLRSLYAYRGGRSTPKVTIVTTKWDCMDESGIAEKLQCVNNWKFDESVKDLLMDGPRIYHHGLVQQSGTYRTLHLTMDDAARRLLARTMILEHYFEPSGLIAYRLPHTQIGSLLQQIKSANKQKESDYPTEACKDDSRLNCNELRDAIQEILDEHTMEQHQGTDRDCSEECQFAAISRGIEALTLGDVQDLEGV
ncbi:hypothetical protein P170DRAFT_471435 [Aspergillus steynii IBT 23096]|uniref:G domain-containing protein n=1 Tax=Aspergillus steynii IBT 23096 TaxID=1392250 RepID=A0A2I2GF55_9EURO|nr:uncharacterized protein P170DRAFT_471435 [Aspergillus steynii IBT 23096]PLB51502.1 hypothetical protein P170DRAFT_471435 [Aspergillus steynii IBT 23096]